jgi:uncharacterized protein
VGKSKREFVIPFIGLKIGSHTFEFDVSDAFFEEYEYSIIHNGKVHVDLILEKKETMMIGVFSCKGEVSTSCDRCNDPLNVQIRGSFQLVFKQATEQEDDEALIVLPPEAYELDVAPHIYELITVSLPVRMIHEEGGCNEEMVEALSQYLLNPEDDEDLDNDDYDEEDWDEEEDNDDDDDPDGDIDPRWSVLKDLN